jgi:hypothetical protein
MLYVDLMFMGEVTGHRTNYYDIFGAFDYTIDCATA